MNLIFLLASIAVLSAFTVFTAFILVYSVKNLLDSGVKLKWYLKAVAYFWLAVGYPADIIFNWIWGTVIFRELPREGTFSKRVQRHLDESLGWRLGRALEWGAVLNAVDHGHVRI